MLKTAVALTVALATPLAAGSSVADGAESRRSAPVQAELPATASSLAVLPPELVALEQKMGELRVTSLRFSSRDSITLPHSSSKLGGLLKLLTGTGISGEVTISPPAGNVVLTLFGHPLTLRVVDGITYFYLRALAAKDHGRPWIKLGRGGLAELFTVNGKHVKPSAALAPKISEPSLAEPPFEGLRKTLAGAQEVRELGLQTLEGQPVTTFLAILSPEQLKREHLASAAQLQPQLPPTQPSPSQPTTATMEVSFAQNGLPMRTVITAHRGETVISATLLIPAIDFPLTIEPPLASQTISLAQVRRMERHDRRETRGVRGRKQLQIAR